METPKEKTYGKIEFTASHNDEGKYIIVTDEKGYLLFRQLFDRWHEEICFEHNHDLEAIAN
jgi:hypothetical protein